MIKYHFYNKPCKSAILALGILFTVTLPSSLLRVHIRDMRFSQHWKVTLRSLVQTNSMEESIHQSTYLSNWNKVPYINSRYPNSGKLIWHIHQTETNTLRWSGNI
jgi:hypothetical protein